MSCSVESNRRKAWRKGTFVLCTYMKVRYKVQVDRGGRSGIHASKKSAFHTTSVDRTQWKRGTTTIHCSHTSGGKHGTSSWALQRTLMQSSGRYIFSVRNSHKQRYPQYQKLAYSVFMIAWKLWHYFLVHPIIVVNEAPLSNILNNLEAIGRVSLWGIEISPLVWEKKGHQISNLTRFHHWVAWAIKHMTTRAYGQCTSTFQKESKAQEWE
jgi:hypothetical protein